MEHQRTSPGVQPSQVLPKAKRIAVCAIALEPSRGCSPSRAAANEARQRPTGASLIEPSLRLSASTRHARLPVRSSDDTYRDVRRPSPAPLAQPPNPSRYSSANTSCQLTRFAAYPGQPFKHLRPYRRGDWCGLHPSTHAGTTSWKQHPYNTRSVSSLSCSALYSDFDPTPVLHLRCMRVTCSCMNRPHMSVPPACRCTSIRPLSAFCSK